MFFDNYRIADASKDIHNQNIICRQFIVTMVRDQNLLFDN